jgi:hypothetical protein
MENVAYPDYVECPLEGKKIDAGGCLENRDIVNGSYTPHIPRNFMEKHGWKGICRKCKWHNVY